MDLITGLPQHNGKDAILTIVDHGCSRAAVFLPCETTITEPGIAQLYLNHVYRWFGLPSKVISDRDSRFTSHFERALCQKLNIQQNLSSAFHPQTDGISERKNQWVEQYLRLVTSASPESWTNWLSLASAVHNNRENATTRLSPNQILLGYKTTLVPDQSSPSTNETAQRRIQSLLEHWARAIDAINQTARQNGGLPSQFKIGQRVWLEATHLQLRHQKTKLAPKRYGPFNVIEEISPVTYQIELPMTWNIHNVFHSSLLSPYHENEVHGPNFTRPPPDLINEEEEYEVERVVNHRYHGRSRQLQYLIKWKRYPESDNTWESNDQVHAPDLLKDYHRLNPLQRIKDQAIRVIKACPIAPNDSSSSNPTNPSDTSSSSIRTNYRSPTVGNTLVSVDTCPAPFTIKRCPETIPQTCRSPLSTISLPLIPRLPSAHAPSATSLTNFPTKTRKQCESSPKDCSAQSKDVKSNISLRKIKCRAMSNISRKTSSTSQQTGTLALKGMKRTETRCQDSSSQWEKDYTAWPNGLSELKQERSQDMPTYRDPTTPLHQENVISLENGLEIAWNIFFQFSPISFSFYSFLLLKFQDTVLKKWNKGEKKAK